MPASAVISAPIVYLKIVAVKKPVVEARVEWKCNLLLSEDFYLSDERRGIAGEELLRSSDILCIFKPHY